MRNESMRQGLSSRRVLGLAISTALCVGVAYAADPPKSGSTPAKKPAPVSKSPTAASKEPSHTIEKASSNDCKGTPDACKTTKNFVEPICAPGAPQPSAQKFNTFEDIYSPPAKALISAPADSTPPPPDSDTPASPERA